jgi:ubiquinone biosynthesis monooxygenase Coq7
MLRIDLAGEVAANRIYEGQKCILGRDPEMAKLLKVLLLIPFISLNEPFQQMHEQEVEHLRTLNELAWQYNARQTIFTPLAHGIAYVLGEIYPYQIY